MAQQSDPVPRKDDNDESPFGTRLPGWFTDFAMRGASRLDESWLGRRLAFLLRHVAVYWLRGPIDATVFGVRMRLYPFNNVCEKRILFTPQYFDPRERELLLSRVTPDFIFVDIGANIGGYSLLVAAQAGAQARIFAIEPQPVIFQRLTYNIAQNPFGTMKAIACAVADADGEMTLFLDPHNRGQASIKMVAGGTDGSSAVRVPSRTLMTLLADEGITRLDAVKLDVEGAEDLILEPFLRDAPRALLPRLLLVGNVQDRWQRDIPALLVAHGYRKIQETHMNLAFELT